MELSTSSIEASETVPDIAGRDVLLPAIDTEDETSPINAVEGHNLPHLPFDLRRVDI